MNYHSFQEVMNLATTEPDGTMWIKLDGHELVCRGSSKSVTAQNLHNAVVDYYERQQIKDAQAPSGKDTPDSDNQWNDDAASQHRGGATSIEATVQTGEEGMDIKDIIQERYTRQRDVVERLEHEFKVIKTDLRDAVREMDRIEAAGNAVGGIDKNERDESDVRPEG
jgi:hypothetical protein